MVEEQRVFTPREGDIGSSLPSNGGRGIHKAEPHSSQLEEAGDLEAHVCLLGKYVPGMCINNCLPESKTVKN